MGALIRKEIADLFSSRRLALVTALALLTALASAHLASLELKSHLAQGLAPFLEGRLFLMLFGGGELWPLFAFAAYLGPVAAIIMGFDSICRERREGTLIKLLAQPVHRDQLLGAKYLAALAVLALMLAALLLFMTGYALSFLGLIPSPEELARLTLLWFVTTLYLATWLALALWMSVIRRSALAALLAALALWLSLSLLLPLAAQGTAAALVEPADPLRPTQTETLAQARLARALSLVSPVKLYSEAAALILDPSRRSGGPAPPPDSLGRLWPRPLALSQSLILILPHLAALLLWLLLASALAARAFSRRDFSLL